MNREFCIGNMMKQFLNTCNRAFEMGWIPTSCIVDLIEGHNRFSVHTALQFAEAMMPYKPTWFEAPVPPHRLSSMIEVAKRSPVPVACGEDYYSREQFAELLQPALKVENGYLQPPELPGLGVELNLEELQKHP